jgi:hypothetical protein
MLVLPSAETITDHDASPIFVLCTARSGSTLLRAILGAHPEVACPPETNLVTIFSAIHAAAQSIASDYEEETGVDWSSEAERASRMVAASLMEPYVAREGKTRWCEKSLPSLDQPELLAKVFPGARFVCLYRNSMDTIASLLEASPYGFGAFGIEPYVRSSPGNLVLALGRYWVERAEHLQAFELEHAQRCVRLTYEDMVSAPEAALRPVFERLNLRWERACVASERVFARRTYGLTLGDGKIRYTNEIHRDSVGRGWRVPRDLLPIPLLERINLVNSKIGYEELRTETPTISGAGAELSRRRKPLGTLVEVEDRLRTAIAAIGVGDAPSVPWPRMMAVRLVGADSSWLIDFHRRTMESIDNNEVGLRADCLAVADEQTLIGIAGKTINPATALRNGALQVLPSADVEMTFAEQVRQADALVALLA